MTPNRRRLFCFALALALFVTLLPAGTALLSARSAKAEGELGKTTIHKVNVRYGASPDEKLIFQIPEAGYVGTLKGEKTVNGVRWVRVEFRHPDPDNDRYYTGWMKGEFFTLLSAEEAAQYKMGDYIATPTPIPSADPVSGETPSPTPAPTEVTRSEAEAGTTGVLTSSGVNLRKGPSKSFGVITQLNRGDVVTVLEIPSVISESTFYRVRYGDLDGWIMSTYLRVDGTGSYTPSPVSTATPTPAPTPAGVLGYVRTTVGGVNLRQTPGGTVITTVKRNRTYPYILEPIKTGGYTWYFVQVDDNRGYLRGDCVKVVSAPGATTPPPATPTATAGNTPTAAPDGSVTGYIITTKGGVNLRRTPGGDVITTVKRNRTYPYLMAPVREYGYDWYYVETEFGRGYLRGDCVKTTGAPNATTPPATATATATAAADATPTATAEAASEDQAAGYVVTTASGVNLREESDYGDVIGRLSKGTVVPYYKVETVGKVTWYYVKDAKLGYGWLHGSYVSQSDGSGKPVTPATTAPAATTPAANTPAATTPAATGGAAVTPDPNAGKAEASYSTLKLGSSGNAVKNLITELINQGYYTGEAGTKYTSAVEEAVIAFQRANGLAVDGIAGSATQHKLFNTVPIGSGDTKNLTMTLYPAEVVYWSEVDSLWARGSNYKIYDVKTKTVWWAHRWAGGSHADIEPLTAADTARLCKIYGVSKASEITDYTRRPCLVTIGTRTIPCSLYGVPHNPSGDTIADNDMVGQICLHFLGSRIHESGKVDKGHWEAMRYAFLNDPNGHIGDWPAYE